MKAGFTSLDTAPVGSAHFTELRHRLGVYALALAIAFAVVTTTTPAAAQTFDLLHTFTGVPDGEIPLGGFIDLNGTLYGTTSGGGTGNCTSQGSSGCGTVFSISSSGAGYTVLYNFTGAPDGAGPAYGMNMISDGKGNLYGTTAAGGTGKCKQKKVVVGCVTVFVITTAGKEHVLYSFKGGTKDGWAPFGGLVRDAGGNLYGTTVAGGSGKGCKYPPFTGCGTVFEITSSGHEQILRSFKGSPSTDGKIPVAGLALDSAGNLYGTTLEGGGGATPLGTVFKVTASGSESVLYNFDGSIPSNGIEPFGTLFIDGTGNLYGTTFGGGTGGTVFELAKSGAFSVLHSFAGGTSDGLYPEAGVVMDGKGNLYGTTFAGGADDGGTVFEIETNGTQKLLWSLNGTTNGLQSYSTLVVDAGGNLYGTTGQGADLSCGIDNVGCGTAFKIVP